MNCLLMQSVSSDLSSMYHFMNSSSWALTHDHVPEEIGSRLQRNKDKFKKQVERVDKKKRICLQPSLKLTDQFLRAF